MKRTREDRRRRRHLRVRKKIGGTAERPRLCVYRSLKHIYAQVVDDNRDGKGSLTLCSASTKSKDLDAGARNNIETAKKVGALIGRKAKKEGDQEEIGFLLLFKESSQKNGLLKSS